MISYTRTAAENSAYFRYGTRTAAYGAVDNYVYESVRHFLPRRHQVQSRGTSRFSVKAVAEPKGSRRQFSTLLMSGDGNAEIR